MSQPPTPRRITVARPGALGDTLLTLPALAWLRRWAPGATLTFIARADTLPLAIANGLAEAACPWDLPDWGALFEDAAPRTPLVEQALAQADLLIVWAPDVDGGMSRRLRSLGVGHVVVAPALPPSSGDTAHTHATVWLVETLRPLGVPAATREQLIGAATPLRSRDADRAQVEAIWRDLDLPEGVVALHPGSGSQVKRWPAERFAAVARLASDAGYSPLLLGGDADTRALAETRAALGALGIATPTLTGLPVTTLAALLARCAGYVGCDSGISHLAGLTGVPTIAVFGPTDPARWSPLGPRALAVRSPDGRLATTSAAQVWQGLLELMRDREQGPWE